MPQYKKCVVCGEPILPAESCIPYKGRFAHNHCFNEAMKTMGQGKQKKLAAAAQERKKTKKNSEAQLKTTILKDGMSEEEYAQKKEYYEYLRTLIGDAELTVKQFAVSEKYIKQYSFTFEGMYQTLVYLNEVLQKELRGDIVGIIPYYYSEASAFNNELERIAKANEEAIPFEQLYPNKVINISPAKRKIKIMDIESIGN